jgi:single-strand DNA-binding protein
MLNIVVLIGNMTRDPELRYSTQGVPVTNFTLAVNNGYGEDQQASFFRIVCFKKTAENVAQYTNKGSLVAVSGRLQSRNYEKDGQRHTIVEVVAHNVRFLDNKKDSSNSNSSNGTKSNNNNYGQYQDQQSNYDEQGDLPF